MQVTTERGPIAWMAKNSVAANLLMVFLLVGGLMATFKIKQEVFPEFSLDLVQIRVPYPSASPAEVEQGIILAIEEEVRGLDGVKQVSARAFEGMGTVTVELLLGTNSNKAHQDIKNAIDRLRSFPEDAERPVVSLMTNRHMVISLVIYGDQEESVLRSLAEHVREGLLAKPDITLVELSGVRQPEISIEVPQEKLRAYSLTLEDIAQVIRRNALEIPGGAVKTRKGEILLRVAERRNFAEEFADIPIITASDGTTVRLRDIASIIDGFEDIDQASFFDGKPAVKVDVYRVGHQTPLKVAEVVKKYAEDFKTALPPAISVTTWDDRSEIYRDRIDLLLRNAFIGLGLVLILLGLFLGIKLAFWVAMGIPVSILGALLILPSMDVSINMISLFAFIITIGIVVDDAIVVGENIYEMRQRGLSMLQASIAGARQIAMPVTFSILTNIAAFMPMLFVPGIMGKIFKVIPAVVVSVFILSLIESLFILPAHLGHQRTARQSGFLNFVNRPQQFINNQQKAFVKRIYKPVLKFALRNKYITLAIGIFMLLTTVGMVAGGRINFNFMPRIESDMATAGLVFPYGTPVEKTKKAQALLVRIGKEILAEHGGESITRGIFTSLGTPPPRHGPAAGGASIVGGHLATVLVFMVTPDKRDISATEFAREWRKRVGTIPGVESLTYSYSFGPSAGAAFDVELSHPDLDQLEKAALELGEELKNFAGVKDIDNGFSSGKTQLDFKLKMNASSLGITAVDLGRQVRGSFYGVEALRQQRGRDEIKVMVRLPEAQRESEYQLEELLIRTKKGGEIPLSDAASIVRGRSYTDIRRADGRRVVDVTADINRKITNAGKVLADLKESTLPKLLRRYPGLHYSLEGERRAQMESLQSLGQGFLLALIVIFAMLAIPFKSYIQPVIIMVSIPFGIVGAVLGHLIMGYDLSLISMFGIVALAGVVVNDSLILIDSANRQLLAGYGPYRAIRYAGCRRFRPILLTSITTFLGLAPMIFETSLQARFLVPMAISLGYGILFSTLITLVLVPALFLIIEDIRRMFT